MKKTLYPHAETPSILKVQTKWEIQAVNKKSAPVEPQFATPGYLVKNSTSGLFLYFLQKALNYFFQL